MVLCELQHTKERTFLLLEKTFEMSVFHWSVTLPLDTKSCILQQYQKCCLLCDIVGINFCEKVQQVKNCAARFTFICMQNSALILVQILNSLSHRAIYTVLCRKRKVRGEKKTQGPFIECHSKLDFRLLKNVAEPVPRYRVARSDVETNIWRWSKRDWLSLLLAQE